VRRAYFDASAVVKLSRIEQYSQALIDYLAESPLEASTSIVAEVEVRRALRRAGTGGDQAVTGFYLIALEEEIRLKAAQLGSPLLRSLDAIHLATALAIGDNALEFITYDDRQAEAARDVGLKVVQPGR
jgi:predicted nucleic acid-binding protein